MLPSGPPPLSSSSTSSFQAVEKWHKANVSLERRPLGCCEREICSNLTGIEILIALVANCLRSNVVFGERKVTILCFEGGCLGGVYIF